LNEHKLFKQKTKIQAKYIAELKKHIAEQDQGIMMLRNQASSCDVLAEEYARQHALLTQELKDKEFDIWKERGVGFGAGLLIVIGVLIFK
jgi:hypothetical protein